MKKILLSSLVLLLLGTGCDSALYGEGMLYIWNGGDKSIEVKVNGRTSFSTDLRSEIGKLYREVIAGEYEIQIDDKVHKTTITKERLTVVNAHQKGCFARADVSGMYRKKNPPIKVLELYAEQEIIEIKDLIDVLPGERMPFDAPRTPYAFQRFVIVPCRMATQKEHADDTVAEFLQRVK